MALRLTVSRRFDGLDVHAGHLVLDGADGRIVVADATDPRAGEPDPQPIPDFHLDLTDEDVTLLPGMIDAHVHLAITNTDPATRELPPAVLALRMLRNGHAQLRAGVTTVRDLGAPDGLDGQLRRAFADGLATGPRLVVAGRPLVAPGGHAAFMGRPVANADEARRAVAEAVAAGVDWVKLMATAGLSSDGAEASEQQLPEAVLRAAVEEAHAAGLPVAAHAVAGPGVRAAIEAGVDSLEHGYALDAGDVAAMREHRTTYVPTRTVVRQVAEALEIEGSRLLRRPDLGTLAVGARADLLVVRGDPLRDVRALRDPLLVVQGGVVVWCAPEVARRGVVATLGA